MITNYKFKNKILFILIVLTGASTFQCSKSPIIQKNNNVSLPYDSLLPAHIISNYKLVWNDEFNGNAVDTTKWNYRAEGSVRQHATVSRKTISTDGKGNLIIKVIKDSTGKYFVGQLGTEKIFETTYGYFECRAMMNNHIGPHIAYWLQSPTMGQVGNPTLNGTEIDIFEYHKKNPDSIYHTIHWDGYAADHKEKGVKKYVENIASGYHTFGLEWTKDEYIFYINGKESWRTSTAVSNRSEYMILSTELTGFGGNPVLGSYPDSVVFDYVRVYKPKQ